jgi:hypothetical protein
MTAPTYAFRHVLLFAAFLLAFCVFSSWLGASARAANLEHDQVVAGLHNATLEARINPEGAATRCQAQYVSEADFAIGGWAAAGTVACEPQDLGAGTEPVTTSTQLGGLALSTPYRYRFLLATAGGTTPAGEGQFSTFGIESFSFRTLDAAQEPETQAGAHPYELIVKVVTPTTEVETGEPAGGRISPTGTIKNLLNELPPGLVGNPTAVPSCTVREAEEQKCSGNAQVGLIEVRYAERTEEEAAVLASPLYNTIPPQGKAARFSGFINASTDAFVDSAVRTGDDYGITSGGFNVSGRTSVYGITVRLWGVPADSSHDAKRTCPIAGGAMTGCASTGDELPFLRNPTSCTGPLTVRARLDSYQSPEEYDEAQATLPAITGCAQLHFEPSIEVRPTSEVADSPTGLHVDLRVPQNENPDDLATADLREAVVKLPPGLTLNPSSANGLEACTPEQFGLTTPIGVAPIHTTAAPATCPDAAKIGTVEIDTPLLDHPLSGAVYVAEPDQNPFGSLLAIYVAVADTKSGVVIKLAGDVEIGPGGQLTTTFADNPQLPFDSFKLDFFGGDLAALKTPEVCGSYETTSTLTPWSAPETGPPVSLSESHSVGQAAGGGSCPTSEGGEPNSPAFAAGSESPLAGAFSPFVVRLARPDGSQRFSSLTITPPPGLLGRLAGIPYCSDAALAAAAARSGTAEREAPSCSSASRVGSVVVGAGAGSNPYYVSGKAYLAGPYKDAPLSLAIVTPAVAGPYDLGDVVVRAALEVDPETAQITVKSDPIPTELKGIPLDVRSIAVKMDRSDFTVNPTNCEEMTVGGSLTTAQGATAPLSNRFKVGGCRKLAFHPRFSLRLGGATKRNRHPSVRALVRPRSGQANISRTAVLLPPTLQIDNASIQTPCTRVQFTAEACPQGSILGRAKAFSPLLDRPLEGPVYFRSNGGERVLPDLVADLHGQIDVVLVGQISAVNRRIRTVFATVPDAPVSRFELRISGGRHGWLVNNDNLCKQTQRAAVKMRGQNGRIVSINPTVATTCKKKDRRSAPSN